MKKLLTAMFSLIIGASFLFAADEGAKDKEKEMHKGHDKKTHEEHMKKMSKEKDAKKHEEHMKEKEDEHSGHGH